MKPNEIDMKNWQWLPVDDLEPYALNAKTHPDEQIRNLMQSLRDYGWTRPITVNADKVIIIGHGILLAAKALGLEKVPVVIRDDLDEEEQRKLRNLDNKLSESPWDLDLLQEDLQGLDLSDYKLDFPEIEDPDAAGKDRQDHFWDQEAEDSEESKAFEEKFVPKKTTDDCYTPPNIYEAVLAWATERYGLQGRKIVRPFYPGGDYQQEDYPEGCVVLDNPPFSILSEIVRFYMERGIDFFLFAPRLSLFSVASGSAKYLPVEISVTYENGARVATSFVTSLGEYKIEVSPELYEAVLAAENENTKPETELPNYEYPVYVVTAPTLRLARYGQALRILPGDALFVRALDEQRKEDKAIYGGGFLLSEKAAAEKAAAEKAAAEKAAQNPGSSGAPITWKLSDREQALIRGLSDAG